MSDVPLAVLQRGDALGDEALLMLEDGASTGAAAAWLDSQSDVAEVEWDDGAIWFRPEGGVGIWILRESVFSPEKRSAGASTASPRARLPPPSLHIVGDDRQEKRALVLSPFQWQAAEFDDGGPVTSILTATRGYENRVAFRANPVQTSRNVGIESFADWDDFDVIHLTTHGKRICKDGKCRGTLVIGVLEHTLPPGPGTVIEKLAALSYIGLTYAKGEKSGLDLLVLNADFLRSYYPGGLDNSVIFLSACQSFGPEATDLVDAIKGTTSMVLGWTEAVYAGDATAAAVAFYQALSHGGYPAKVAFDNLGAVRTGRAVDHDPAPQLRISERQAGGDLRIREVVYLLHPGTGEVMAATDKVPIQGTQGDGTPDAVPYLIRIDGVRQQHAAGMTVHISIDGVEGPAKALTSGQFNAPGMWTVGGVLPLSYDLEDETEVTFKAWVNLHSGGESRHERDATLTGEEPIMGTLWDFEATQTSRWVAGIPHTPYGATTRMTLRFAPGQSPGEPNPRYVVTGGTVTYNYSHSYYDCTYTAPAITFEVTPSVSQDSRLDFNTTVSPIRYHGVIYTQGPNITVTGQCGGGSTSTRTQRAANTWLLFNPPDARTVSTDRRSISGTYRVTGAGGDFIIETNYTIRRIE